MPIDILISVEDISVYPTTIADPDFIKDKNLIIADLHGNCMKLIYILIRFGVMRLEKADEDYQILQTICLIPATTLTSLDIHRFCDVLGKAKFSNAAHLTILGDDLADRLYNDLLMLFVYVVLLKHAVIYSIILSNHGELALRSIRAGEYIQEIGRYIDDDPTKPYINMQISLTNLWTLIDRGVVSLDLVRRLMDYVYKPYLCLVGYQINELDQLIGMTHAPVGLKQIRTLMQAWDVTYDDTSIKSFTQGIDQLNQKYRRSIEIDEWSLGPFDPSASARLQAMAPLLGQRLLPIDFTLTSMNESFAMLLFHGHVGETPDWKGTHLRADFELLLNLDTDLGKTLYLLRGMLRTGLVSMCSKLELKPLMQAMAEPQVIKNEKFEIKLRALLALTNAIDEHLEPQEPSRKFIDEFNRLVKYLCGKSKASQAFLYEEIICAMPEPLTINALAAAILDYEDVLTLTLAKASPEPDMFVIECFDRLECIAEILLDAERNTMGCYKP